MANIILIEEDDRIRHQMQGFINELNADHRVRIFKSLPDFEKVYFRAKAPEEAVFDFHPQLKTLPPDCQLWLRDQTLSTAPAFEVPQIKIETDISGSRVLSISPTPSPQGTIFGLAANEFIAQPKALEAHLPLACQKSFEECLKKLTTNPSAQCLLIFSSLNNDLWIIQARVSKKPQGLSFQLQDLTPTLSAVIQEFKENGESEENEELKLLSQIDLVIMRASYASGPKTNEWYSEFHDNLKKFKLYPEEFRTRLIVTKFEDDNLKKIDLLHPLIDDIIFLPLDRLIFLQKVEIILGLPAITKPSYLFSQEAILEIEIAKQAWVEKLSDVAVVIKNPVPLISGLIAHIYLEFPTEKESIEAYAKVIRSEPHPQEEGEFLVTFSFFGLDRETQTRIRRHLAKDSRYVSLVNNDKTKFQFNPDDLLSSEEERRPKNIILIDNDHDSYGQVVSIIKENLENVQIAAFNTYSSFLSKYFEKNEIKIDINNLQPASTKDLLEGSAEWNVSLENSELVQLPPPVPPETLLLGYSLDELFQDKTSWRKLFNESHDSLLEEAFKKVELGSNFETILFLQGKDGKAKAVEFWAKPHESGAQIILNSPKSEVVKDFVLLQNKFTTWDVLIMDSSFLPDNPTDWLINIENNARQRGYIKSNESLKIILLDNQKLRRPHKSYSFSQVRSLLIRPVEPRSLSFNLSSALNLPFTIYNIKNLGWSLSKLSAHVAKEAKLAYLAEFGAGISHPRPIAPGTFLFLRGSIFDYAPRKNLCARFYACEEDPNQKNSYICSLLYFGINEDFTRFARTWFRENYAASKQADN